MCSRRPNLLEEPKPSGEKGEFTCHVVDGRSGILRPIEDAQGLLDEPSNVFEFGRRRRPGNEAHERGWDDEADLR